MKHTRWTRRDLLEDSEGLRAQGAVAPGTGRFLLSSLVSQLKAGVVGLMMLLGGISAQEAKAQPEHQTLASLEVAVQADTAVALIRSVMVPPNADGTYPWTFKGNNGANIYYVDSAANYIQAWAMLNNWLADETFMTRPHALGPGTVGNNVIQSYTTTLNDEGRKVGFTFYLHPNTLNALWQAMQLLEFNFMSNYAINGNQQWTAGARNDAFIKPQQGKVEIPTIGWLTSLTDSSPENASAIRTDDLDTVAITVDEVTNTTQITGVIHKHSSNPNYLPLTVYNNDSLQVTLANGDTLTTAASYVYDAVNQRYDVSAQINTCEPITSVRVKGNGPGSVTIYDWWGDQYLVNNYQGIADNTILSQEDPYEIPSDVTYTIDVGNIVGGIADSVTIALGGSLPASAQLDLTITDGTNSYTGVHDAGLDAFVFTNIPTGTYDCTLARGACTMTVSILIDGTTAVGEASLPGVSLFPDPAHDRLTVRHQGAPFVHYRIRSLAGQLVAQGSLQGNTIAIGGLAPGAYLLHLVPATGAPVRERFIKQ